jgi:hypothetical protein
MQDTTHLNGLIDLLVEELVREIESTNEKPPAPWQASPGVGDQACESLDD